MSNAENPKPILPKKGQIIIEDIQDLVLCKPRLIPLKSFTLEKLEKMQQEAQKSQMQQSPKEE
ncbi:BBSome-interacting protein 1 [Tribolium madens]|uniref:BBSome-interacting protein 1 n=1 Tax=Tribolium madens TaxID=41895 RepID=UPI001CF75A66|nr:BBSome-interacting protein 1 [Tribolium madens]